MSNSKTVTDLLNQIQSEFQNYRTKLANRSAIGKTVIPIENDSTGVLTVEDSYSYEVPDEAELPSEFYSNQLADTNVPVEEYVLDCACHNVKNEETQEVIETATSVVENVDEPVPVVEEVAEPVPVEPKKTEKEKSFFN